MPKCHLINSSKTYKCGTLTSRDIFFFHKSFYANPTKIYQDNFILKYCLSTKIKRRRPTQGTRNTKEFSTRYFIRKHTDNTLVPVCLKSFLGILRLKKGRIQGVLKRHMQSGEMAKESRGGDRKTFEFSSRKEAVENFIKSFTPLESHYCRGKERNRVYLAPDLSIKKMYSMYNDQALPGYSVTVSYFRKVFNTSFNIGFGAIRQDVCSTCLQLTENIKVEKDTTKKQELMTKKRIHKLRAKAFFNQIKEEKEGLLTISFDCQKNLPMPKIPDQATYYSRQIYLYNFTVVVGSSLSTLKKDNVFAYVWTEDIAAKSSNEICSALYHALSLLDLSDVTTIRLMADGCAGQNKNSMMLGMLLKWFNTAPSHIKRIEVIYPVTGHSFIPPDRVFALIEKKCRSRETIINPQEYLDLISEHATVRHLAIEIPIFDWRTATRNILKKPDKLHFKISTVKRIIIARSRTNTNLLVRAEISYNSDIGQFKNVLAKGKKITQLQPERIPCGNSVAQAKLTDVKNLLLKHYGDEWKNLDDLKFFKQLLERDNNNVPHTDNDDCQGHEIEEVIDFV